MAISKADFKSRLQDLDGHVLLTKTGQEYKVHFENGKVQFTPQSTRETRSFSNAELEKGLAQFNETQSLVSTDYRGHGVNSSYYLPVLEQMQESRETAVYEPEAHDLQEPDQPNRTRYQVTRIIRNTALAQRVKEEHDYRCQICDGTIDLGNGRRYAEAHHVRPLGKSHSGPDVKENIMCVCPNHHVLLDFGAIRIDSETLEGVGQSYIDYHNAYIFQSTKEAL